MTKTVFLSLLSLLLLVGCNNDETATKSQDDDNAKPESSAPVGFEIGNQAPEITGEDIDGVAFKLSDYRGKVVMLDFWGDW